MTTKAATMKTPDSTADTIVITGDTFLLPLSSSPKSLARLPRYTYSKVPTHYHESQELIALLYGKLAVNLSHCSRRRDTEAEHPASNIPGMMPTAEAQMYVQDDIGVTESA